jgi:hypothetical protein
MTAAPVREFQASVALLARKATTTAALIKVAATRAQIFTTTPMAIICVRLQRVPLRKNMAHKVRLLRSFRS